MATTRKTRQRADSRQRVVKVIDGASGPLNSMSVAIKKMFGPLTPAELRELRAVARRVVREAEKLLRTAATKPRKRRVSSKQSPKKGA
jgi:3-deoxy-D-arabino-heptulosonate 7-phosphate (DAHP) synthase